MEIFRNWKATGVLRNIYLSSYRQSKGKVRRFSSIPEDSNVIRSPSPDVALITGATIPEFVRSRMGNWGKSVAFECAVTGLRLTHDQVWKTSQGFAAALLNSDLRQGETVSIVLPNHPFYATVLYGIWQAGLIASTVNPSYTIEEMSRQLKDSNTKWVVTTPQFLPSIRAIKKMNENIKSIVVIGEAEEDCHTFSEMIKTDASGANFLKGDSIDTVETVAFLPYSSGTTGLPKGVMITHAGMATNLNMVLQPDVIAFTVNEESPERMVGVLPFFHMFGISRFMMINMAGGSFTAILPKFDPNLFLHVLRKYKPTVLNLVPPLISHLVSSPEIGKKEFESIHTVSGSAAPIGPLLVTQLLEKAGKYIFFQESFGMTELSPGGFSLRSSTKNTKIGSCGVPFPSTLCKIISLEGDRIGQSLGPNQKGEICVKGPQVMKGYWKNPEATKNTIDSEGWLHTGDIGYYDEDKHIYIVDRLKELIKVKGFQVAPAEVEDALKSHPNIVDAAVIGIVDKDAGELPRGYIVRDNPTLSPEAINLFLKGKLTSYKQLKGGIEFVDKIPKTASGKILRKELKKDYTEKQRKEQ